MLVPLQAGAVPAVAVSQGWDHMSTLHENSTVQMIPEQPHSVTAAAAARPGMPVNDVGSRGISTLNHGCVKQLDRD